MELVPLTETRRLPALAAPSLVPVGRHLDLRKVGSVFAKMAGPSRAELEPRKGATQRGMMPLQRLQQAGVAEKPSNREGTTNLAGLKALADRDDIIWSIRSTIRRAIGEMEHRVVPDLDGIKADLKRWQTVVLVNLALPGFGLEFTPQAISLDIYRRATGALKDTLRDVLHEGDEPATSPKIRGFFDNVVAAHEAIALSHVAAVDRIFQMPNATQKTFREFNDLIVDDLTLYDAGVLVKNATMDGALGELYHLPGWQIRPYRAKDRSIPSTPFVAYDWVVDAITKAYFNNAELTYMSVNPQESGYGRSPLEAVVEQMVGAVYGDAYLIDGFANNNMPFFVFDLGPNVQEGERRSIEKAWDQRVSQGSHRGIFVANADGVKGFMPAPSPADKDSSTIDKLKFWANRKCAAYGLSLNDIGFTEDLHRTTSETQQDLTQTRGIDSFARVIEEKYNNEVVHGKMWVRDDPENPNSFAGRLVDCFPFKDVRLNFETGSKDDRLEKAEGAIALVKAGIWSINESRKEMDDPPVAGGDVHVVFDGGAPMKVEDLPNLPQPKDPTEQPTPGAGQGEAPGAPGQDDGAKQAKEPQNGAPPQLAPKNGDGDDTQKGLSSIERVADRLRKMVTA